MNTPQVNNHLGKKITIVEQTINLYTTQYKDHLQLITYFLGTLFFDIFKNFILTFILPNRNFNVSKKTFSLIAT